VSHGGRVDLEPAFLVHRRAYRETSALIELFTHHHGRIATVGRGARRPRSTLRFALQPFRPLLVGWSGRGELRTLRTVEAQGPARALAGAALLSGLYLNELLLRLTHRDDPHPELYAAYAEAIASLADGVHIELSLRIFEKRMLQAIGYGMLLDRDADSGEPLVRERRYAYSADHGPVSPATRRGASVEVSGATLLALDAEQPLDEAGHREAKRLMRFVLGTHLGDRPLASRALFREAEE
jgi:DNA repair protein RecO (recombination protein O)